MKTILVLAAAAALSAASASAQPPPPNPNCKTQASGAPTLITGTAQASQQQQAQMSAQSDWSAKAGAFGGAYSVWSKAANKTTNCQSYKPAFSYVYRCTATAQPCR